ncbi:MAG: protein translocase subunit SecD [Chloroflexi bacterium]|nr:protein translocase subunit SecD [Chloroflexota bacterium]
MNRFRRLLPLLGIVLLTLAAIYVVWPAQPDRFLPAGVPWPEGRGVTIGNFERERMRLGLDLQGGTRLLLHADVPEEFDGNIDDAIEGTIRVLRRRVDASGLAEAEITRQGATGISVQLPGLTPEEARSLLGRTAQLLFCEPATDAVAEVGTCDEGGQWQRATGTVGGQRQALSGRFLRSNAYVGFDNIGNPFVGFEFQGEGGEIFRQITTRRLGQQIAIFLDNELLSAPVVSAVIADSGTITGLTLMRARELVVQLNAGALPLELSVLQEQSVDATLGNDSVQRSVLAGEIGLMLVALFMILYYRLPGLIASAALLVYTALTLAVFKMIPVTLTLAGIGAFVLSVGMAVDANILIFERMKEEMRAGRSYAAAIEAGFARAWPSIRDSNVTTLITCLILYVLGGGIEVPLLGAFDAPLVQGFALTLAVGVFMSMFSAIIVTRTFMLTLVGTSIARRHDWFVPELDAELNVRAESRS